MSKQLDQLETENPMLFDHETYGFRYFDNAINRHWDPNEIDLEDDPERIKSMVDEYGEAALERFVLSLKGFAPAEEAVADDLAPFAVALDNPDDQAYITTQMYEEAKHARFFDRYWREVINPVEDELGLERSYPKRWKGTRSEAMMDEYSEFFTRIETAVEALLEDDSPETQAKALCHYHLVGEGIGAQTGYFSQHSLYGSDAVPEMPNLPGYIEGLRQIRQDEGRHVGWGMSKLKELIAEDEVDPQLIHETVDEIMPLVQGLVSPTADFAHLPDVPDGATEEFALEKHEERMQQIVDASEDIPDLDELTQITTADG